VTHSSAAMLLFTFSHIPNMLVKLSIVCMLFLQTLPLQPVNCSFAVSYSVLLVTLPTQSLYSFLCFCLLSVCLLTGVYSRNRNFRLLSSTKLGKSGGELKVAEMNHFVSKRPVGRCLAKRASASESAENESSHELSMEQTFLDSLICNVGSVPLC